jgi:hypothetical protein
VLPIFPFQAHLINEIDANEMQQQTAEDKVRKRPLRTQAGELLFVQLVGLDAERDGEHELADRGRKAREEGVEGVVADDEAVQELDAAGDDQKGQEQVDQERSLRRRRRVVVPDRREGVGEGAEGDGRVGGGGVGRGRGCGRSRV